MKTYRLQQIGSVDGLELCEEPVPTPAAGEVLVRIKANSLNFRDLAILQGWMPFGVEEGRVPLSDAAGIVEAIGPGVTRFKVGDSVVNSTMPNWFGGPFRELPLQYGIHLDGWLSQYRCVSEQEIVAMPAFLTFAEAASLPCAAVTAWTALAGVGPGQTVLTQGTGGVSLFALQLAKASGARVIATTSSEAKAARLRDLGADHVINYKTAETWGEQAKHLGGGYGIDRIVEVGGSGTLAQSLKAVAIGGQISLVGVLAQGQMPGFMDIFMAQATLQPIPSGSRRDLEDMLKVFAQHRLHPQIDRTFSFEDARAAFSHFGARDLFGKVVITQDD
ncbi:zinc-dependent alcohol dehydrogenase family protein [Roseixanthobacter pseudopolyaromaticivorans]|uniref:zinc-dependent alcohol dehydrogenase family protein n=1 Tax=Xanthobacteraceae TaxID=335928 RepID=UPI00372A9B98